jgi:hypothetical protein
MATQPQSGRNGNGQYRRIITDFGGADSIQGTEDLPIDPEVADVKAVVLAGLFGFAAVAAVPQGAPLAYRLVGWVFLALVLLMSLVVVYLTPSDQTPIGWVRAIVQFQRRPKRLTQHADRKEERTQPITGLDRVLPISGALRRDDGAIVGMIEVEGRDMALAEIDAWRAAGKGFEDLADALDGGFDVFSPARTIEPGRLAGGYIGRQFDDDVRNSETLSALVETYQRELPREFRQRGTSVRQFYVVVWVTEREVRREDHGMLAKLADLSCVGGLIRRVGLARCEASDAEIRTRQKSILSARKRTVENSVASIEGCTASVVDGEHFAAVLQEYWTGVRTPHDGKPVPNTTLPVVTVGEADREDPSETGGY